MQYAVVEFSSENFEVVNTSTLRGFDAVAPPRLPCESICNWKKKGSKKTQACTVTIHFAAGVLRLFWVYVLLYKTQCTKTVRSNFFVERVVSVWNCLPPTVSFSSVSSFKRTIKTVDCTEFLKGF